jgi:histidine triad (HIT) family protein
MPSIFSRIASGEIPSYKIAEDEKYFAFLDISPLKKGHTLVISKQEIDYIFDLDDDKLSGLVLFSKKIAAAIRKSFPCKKVSFQVIGLEVPHAHVHLIPINSINDCDFSQEKLKLSEHEFEEIATKIRTNL